MLQSLPNVHTIQIPHAHSAMTTALKDAFKGSSFPSVRTVVMPNCAHEILRCCPEVESITCNEDDGGKLVAAVVEAGCSKLQVVKNVFPGPTVLKRFIKANPPLRWVRVRPSTHTKPDEATIRMFASFPSLRIIEIDRPEGFLDVPDLVKVAKETLQACTENVPAVRPKKTRKGQPDTQDLVD
ncbi:hypothetical protein FRC07_011987, partial [Ceratobasidium sp. 392]